MTVVDRKAQELHFLLQIYVNSVEISLKIGWKLSLWKVNWYLLLKCGWWWKKKIKHLKKWTRFPNCTHQWIPGMQIFAQIETAGWQHVKTALAISPRCQRFLSSYVLNPKTALGSALSHILGLSWVWLSVLCCNVAALLGEPKLFLHC